MKYLILFLFSFSVHAGNLYPDRWVTLTEAQAWTCPASLALIKTADDCQTADPGQCLFVPVAPCGSLDLIIDSNIVTPVIGDFKFEVEQTDFWDDVNTGTIASVDFRKIPHTIDWGTNGQVLTTNGVGEASWSAAGSGDVSGPFFAFDENIAVFDGVTGKVIKDSGVNISAIATPFEPGNETWFDLTTPGTVSNGGAIPFFATPFTRENINLGSSADIILRISDTEGEIVNTGLHNMTMGFNSNKNDTYDLEINGVLWESSTGSMVGRFSLSYFFTAGDRIIFLRTTGGGVATITDVTFSIVRVK